MKKKQPFKALQKHNTANVHCVPICVVLLCVLFVVAPLLYVYVKAVLPMVP